MYSYKEEKMDLYIAKSVMSALMEFIQKRTKTCK